MYIDKFKRIVIKVGSSILVDEKGKAKKIWLKTLAQDIKNLIKKKEIIVFNKIDMIDEKLIYKKINIFKKAIRKEIFTISALKHLGLTNIKKKLFSYVH